jgi:hypothetical protein
MVVVEKNNTESYGIKRWREIFRNILSDWKLIGDSHYPSESEIEWMADCLWEEAIKLIGSK